MSSLKVLDVGAEQENYRELINRRQNLLLELKNYEQNKKVGSGSQSARSSRSEGKTHHLLSYVRNSSVTEREILHHCVR